jgi:hypothetical protein
LYDTSSARDVGTIYHARNVIDARNVTKDSKNNYYAASELLDKFLDAYLIAGALQHFGMASIHDEPTVNTYEMAYQMILHKRRLTSTVPCTVL